MRRSKIQGDKMNKMQRMRRKNQISQLVRVSNRSGSHWNCLRMNFGKADSSDEHEDMKYEAYKALRKRGVDVMTEAIFVENGRADLLTCSGIVYEILHSETDEEFQEKKKRYPKELEIRSIRTGQKWQDKLLD